MKTVLIAGGGPSGLSAAIHLRRSGYPVELFERRGTVGARFLGEYQVLENYSRRGDVLDEVRGMGIETDFELRPVDRAELVDDRGSRRQVRSSHPYGYFLRRGPDNGTIDRALEVQARDLGAVIHFGEALDPREADIVATGPGPADGIAKQMAFRTGAADRIQVIFDPDLAPGGYAYFFVLEGRATLGLALLKEYHRLEDRFETAVERFRAVGDFDVDSPRTGYSYMNFFLHASSHRGSSLYVGEAGGFQDYLFGLGIRYGLVSGHLAARALVEGVDYDRLWADRFGAAMRSSVASRFLYETLGRHGLRLFIRQAASRDFREFLYSWARPSWWRLAMRPVAEWIFGKAEGCGHKVPCTWCRPREGRTGTSESLPAELAAREQEQ